jgi:hypothetical protein
MRRIFWGFCRNWFLIDPVHGTLPFEPFRFWLRIRGDIHNRKTTRRVGESAPQRVGESMTRRVGESDFECLKEN